MRRLMALSLGLVLALAGPALGQGLEDVRAGNEAFKASRYDEAVAAYSRAIEGGGLEGEALAITRNNRGVAYGELSRFDEAIEDYTASLALRPDDRTTIKNLRVAHVRRGQLRLNRGDYAGALADYDTAIDLEPQHYLAYLRRAVLHEERGELDSALEDYRQASTLSPDSDQAARGVARVSDLQASLAAGPTASEPVGPAVSGLEAEAVEEEEDAAAAAVEPAAGTDQDPADAATAARPTVATAEPEAPIVEAPSAGPTGPVADEGQGDLYRAVQAVNVRLGPDNDAERLGAIDGGTEVRVIDEVLGWKHVILPNGEQGYIYKRWLEPAG